MSSFVQNKVDVLAFDLQRQHGRNFASVGHTGNVVKWDSEMGLNKPKWVWLASVVNCPPPRSMTESTV